MAHIDSVEDLDKIVNSVQYLEKKGYICFDPGHVWAVVSWYGMNALLILCAVAIFCFIFWVFFKTNFIMVRPSKDLNPEGAVLRGTTTK